MALVCGKNKLFRLTFFPRRAIIKYVELVRPTHPLAGQVYIIRYLCIWEGIDLKDEGDYRK